MLRTFVYSKPNYEESGPPVSVSVQSKLFPPSALVPSISLTTISCHSLPPSLCAANPNCPALTRLGQESPPKAVFRALRPLAVVSLCPSLAALWFVVFGGGVLCAAGAVVIEGGDIDTAPHIARLALELTLLARHWLTLPSLPCLLKPSMWCTPVIPAWGQEGCRLRS